METAKTVTGVLGLPLNQKGQYLLALRNDPKNAHLNLHNRWEICGGGLEFGESFQECLVREMQEELSVTPKLLFDYPIIHSQQSTFNPKQHLTLACYIVSIGNQTPKPNDEEVSDIGWYFPKEISQLDCVPLMDIFIQNAEKIRTQFLKNVATIETPVREHKVS